MLRPSPIGFLAVLLLSVASEAQVVINEVVTDPMQDWNDDTPFDADPGVDAPNTSDEWVELLNVSGAPVDLSGWTLEMIDTSPEAEILGAGAAILAFSSSSSLAAFQPGGYLVVGDPVGALNNVVTVVLRDDSSAVVDSVSLGVGGVPDGNASSPLDESVARQPNGFDSDLDALDLSKGSATIGSANYPDNVFDDGFESGGMTRWSNGSGVG